MRASTATTIATGTVAGLIGFTTIALGFFLLDMGSGRGAGFTPSLLAAALFQGVTETCDVRPTSTAIAGYTALHLVVFLAIGWLMAWLFRLITAHPWSWIGALFLFVIVAFHLNGAILTILAPVRDCFSSFHVLGASATAAVAMVVYFLREHRHLAAIIARPENQ